MKILIAEDNEDSRVLLESSLGASGYEVESAENGEVALTLATQRPPDLIISDILMPVMDGYALIRAVKADEQLRAIPFIFYTATYTDPSDERLAMDLGASRFIVKPMEMDSFLFEIKKVLEDHKTEKIPTPENPLKSDQELEKGYAGVLAKKLDKKVRQLEDEKERLANSEKQYRRLVEALRDDYFFYTHDTNGVFTYISPSIKNVLGYSQEEFQGHYTEYLTDSLINKDVERYSDLSIKGIKQPPYELEIYHKNGSVHRLEVTEEPILDVHGQVTAVEGIAHDITGEKLDRERLEALLKLNEIGEVSEEEIVNFGLEESVRLTRSKVGYFHFICEDQINLNLFSWSKEALKNCTAKKTLMYPLGKAGIWADSVRTGKPAIHNDYQNEPDRKGYPEGHTHIKSHMSVPVYDKDNMIAIVGVGNKEEPYSETDVRQVALLAQGMWRLIQRKRYEGEKQGLEKKLRQSQKMEAIGTLAGGIAHDFNNILTGIIGYGEMIETELPANSRGQAFLAEVLKAAERAKELVKQIMAFSRQGEVECKPVQVHLIVKEALKLLRSSIPTTVEIRQDIDQNCGAVFADPTQIHQIIMNLCTNSSQAMRDEGGILGVTLKEVTIKSDDCIADPDLKPGRFLRLEVSDTGSGIPPEELERIFIPYFTTKSKGDGTGLGLAVVHGITKSHGGYVTVYSEPGKGSTFHVYLPSIELKDPAEKVSVQKPVIGGNERVLVVDDEESISQLEQKMLDSLGYQTVAFSDSLEALEAFKDRPQEFDLVVTDMTMPHMTGAEFTQKLLAIREDIPIILCTGFSEIINEEKAKALGVRAYVMKPITKKELAKVVRKVLD